MRTWLATAAFLMILTGAGFAGLASFWPLLVVAFCGTLNPSGGDVSVFLPLEHARLAASSSGDARTALFARYSLAGSLAGAIGALAAALPELAASHGLAERLECMRAMFWAYALIGIAVWLLYRAPGSSPKAITRQAPLKASRAIVVKLAALFSVDAFAGGLLVNSLLALWLFERFGMSLTAAAAFFFWTGILSAGSQLAAAPIARRFGLLNTMVFTHIPASVFLIAAALSPNLEVALAFLLLRSALSQMDVPTRSAYVMAVVTPAERPAAASFTAVPRSLAAAAGPALTGMLFSAGALARQRVRGVPARQVLALQAGYSGGMPASLTIRPHLSISLRITPAKCSGVPPWISMPAPVRRERTSSIFSAALIEAFSFETASFGVPAGARMPPQVLAS